MADFNDPIIVIPIVAIILFLILKLLECLSKIDDDFVMICESSNYS